MMYCLVARIHVSLRVTVRLELLLAELGGAALVDSDAVVIASHTVRGRGGFRVRPLRPLHQQGRRPTSAAAGATWSPGSGPRN